MPTCLRKNVEMWRCLRQLRQGIMAKLMNLMIDYRRRVCSIMAVLLTCLTDGYAQESRDTSGNLVTQTTSAPGISSFLPVGFLSANGTSQYVVISENGIVCNTPCTLSLKEGNNHLRVIRPDQRQFEKNIWVPSEPIQGIVHHQSRASMVSGAVLLAISLPLIAGGAWALENMYYLQDLDQFHQTTVVDPAYASVGSILLAHGVASLAIGIIQLVRMKSDRIEIRPQPKQTLLQSTRLPQISLRF